MANQKPPVLPTWGETMQPADTQQPPNAEIQAGWPHSDVAPPRQYFNWFFNWVMGGIRYLCARGLPDWDAQEIYGVGSVVIGDNGKIYRSKVADNINHKPSESSGQWKLAFYETDEADTRFAPKTETANDLSNLHQKDAEHDANIRTLYESKYDKTGGAINGDVTASGTVQGRLVRAAGSAQSPWVAGTVQATIAGRDHRLMAAVNENGSLYMGIQVADQTGTVRVVPVLTTLNPDGSPGEVQLGQFAAALRMAAHILADHGIEATGLITSDSDIRSVRPNGKMLGLRTEDANDTVTIVGCRATGQAWATLIAQTYKADGSVDYTQVGPNPIAGSQVDWTGEDERLATLRSVWQMADHVDRSGDDIIKYEGHRWLNYTLHIHIGDIPGPDQSSGWVCNFHDRVGISMEDDKYFVGVQAYGSGSDFVALGVIGQTTQQFEVRMRKLGGPGVDITLKILICGKKA